MNKKRVFLISLILIIATSITTPLFARTISSVSVNNQQAISLTIYNSNLALIRDSRKARIPAGRSRLIFNNVSEKIQPETVILSTNDKSKSFNIIEQNFNSHFLTPQSLLKHHLNQDIKIIRRNPVTGQENAIRATVLSTHNGLVLQVGNHIETEINGRIHFPNLPDDYTNVATLNVDVFQEESNTQELNLSYLSEGLSWKADYISRLNSDETSIDLNTWVTLSNRSGNHFKNAEIDLISGSISQTHNQRFSRQNLASRGMSINAERDLVQENIQDYQLYRVPHKTDLLNNQQKQIALFSRKNIPIEKVYTLSGTTSPFRHIQPVPRKQRPTIHYRFSNTKEANLGLNLPAGVIRHYQSDSRDKLQLIGENSLTQTNIGEVLDLPVGKSNEIITEKRQVSLKMETKQRDERNISLAEYEIRINNSKATPIILEINESITGQWEILEENELHKRISASTARWHVTVAEKSQSLLKFRVRIVQ